MFKALGADLFYDSDPFSFSCDGVWWLDAVMDPRRLDAVMDPRRQMGCLIPLKYIKNCFLH